MLPQQILIRFIGRGVIVAVFLSMCGLFTAHGQTKTEIQPGDLLFKPAGTAIWTQLAAEYSEGDKRWGHIGVVTSVDGGAIYVTHADSGDVDRIGHVTTTSYERFFGQAGHIGHFRLNLPAQERSAFIANIQKAADERVPFDRGYELTSVNNAYCTELVWRAWTMAIGHDPLPRKLTRFGKAYVALSDISQHEMTTELGRLSPDDKPKRPRH